MAGRFNVMILVAFVFATVLHGSSAQTTTHVVGDALGWTIPPGGEIAYQTWAATQTFAVGDALLFNFTTGRHDVVEVTRAVFDSCDAANVPGVINDGPATINLTSAGEHYYICAFNGHCGAGQKLAINVSASSAAPAPQPATPPPTVAPRPSTRPPVAPPQPAAQPPVAPTPARTPTTHTVGDSTGWTVPPAPTTYQIWAQGKTFAVGDILAFNFQSGRHDVVEVTRSEYDSCRQSTTTTQPIMTGPANVPIASGGEHYYICTIGQHCASGQKLAINVTAAGDGGSPTSPAAPTTPSSGTAPPPGSNSAPSMAVAGLPLALLATAVAFLLN